MNKKNILNYSTKKNWRISIQEIEQLLESFGVEKIAKDNVNGFCQSLIFQIEINNQQITVKLDANYQGILRKLETAKIPKVYKNPAQAKNIVWRILKDFVWSQFEIIEAGIISPEAVFKSFPNTSFKQLN